MTRSWLFRSVMLVLISLLGLALVFVIPARSERGIQQPAWAPRELLAPVGTGFTYQGRLDDGGNPADGSYDFRFELFDADTGGTQVGATLDRNDVVVSHGLFSVSLDFGISAFGGGQRFLQIAVRPGNSTGTYTSLTPRQELTPAPYALAMPNVFTNETENFVGIGRDFRISSNEVFGVRYTGDPNQYGGMYVETSDPSGWPFYGYATDGSFRAWSYYDGASGDWNLYNGGIRLKVPASGGLRIGPAMDYSLVISNTTGTDGIRVLETGDDAIQIGTVSETANYGIFITNPGVTYYGLWPNTAEASGQWALYTVDNIEAGNVLANAYSLLAKVTGADSLTPGDIVAVTGVTDPLPGATDALPMVLLANSNNYSGIIGVVSSRMVLKAAPGKEPEGEMAMQSVSGDAKPGEYVSLIVFGVTEVKIDVSNPVSPGERLTASSISGAARPLASQEINGMLVTEGAPVIGIALAAPEAGKETIPVFVNLR